EDSMYGRMSRESPWITMREKDAFRKVSIDWHRIVGFQPVQTEGRNTAKSLAHMEQQAEADKFQRWRAFRQADMLDAFKRMMGPDAEFRGVQFAILQALMQGHKNVLGIMPTGGGKSLTFMLPARCSPGGVTIVVIPLTALEGDMVRRCKESDIKCAVWDAARPPEWASIVFVTPEAAVGQAFKRFMQQKKSTGELDRLVIDECHVVLDSRRKTAERDAWRPEILELYKTVEQSVQTLFLTATLPPRNELEFYDRMGINKHEIVKFRDSTTRKEIKYQVVDYEKEEEEEALQRMVDDKKRQYPGKQIVVYYPKDVEQATQKPASRVDSSAPRHNAITTTGNRSTQQQHQQQHSPRTCTKRVHHATDATRSVGDKTRIFIVIADGYTIIAAASANASPKPSPTRSPTRSTDGRHVRAASTDRSSIEIRVPSIARQSRNGQERQDAARRR
ncbi:hypothetical protein KCU99_g10243, partial [Aureobasidium melanogenum]